MTRKHLEIYCMVCREHSVTKAAEQLHMTQPAVSRAIAEMEHYYNKKFFDRIGRRITLTAEGEALLLDAEKVLADFEELEVHVGKARQERKLKIGCSLGIGFAYMKKYLDAFHEIRPESKVEVTEGPTSYLQELLTAGELDFALVEGFITEPNLVSRPFFQDELLLLAAPGHPFIKKEKITAADLKETDLILPGKMTATRTLFDHVMKARGVTPEPVWSGISISSLLQLARQGEGITVVSRHWVEEDLKKGTLIELPNDLSMKRNYSIAYHQNKYLSGPAVDFMNVCRTCMEREINSAEN